MKRLFLVLMMFSFLAVNGQNWIAPGDSIIVRNLKITAFPTSTNDSRTLRINNNGAVLLDTLAYSDIPVISSFIDKSRTCNSSRDDKDAFVTAFAATNKLIVDDGCYYINSTLTIPAGKTLIFEPGGMIGGTGTIVFDETEIQAGLNQILDITLSFSGSANVKNVYPEWWGAIADGITDNTIAIKKSIQFSDLSNGTVRLGKGTYKMGIITTMNNDLKIKGDGINSTIIKTDTAVTVATPLISVQGITGTTTKLDSIPVNTENYIIVTSSAGFTDGDVVFIKSDSIAEPTTIYWGEMKKIKKVSNDTLYFNNNVIFDAYNKNADVILITPVNVNISDITFINENISDTNMMIAIRAIYSESSVFNNISILNYSSAGINVKGSYKTKFNNIQTENTELHISGSENGYGIAIQGSVFSDIQGIFMGVRHGVTTGGTSLGGAAYYTNIHDSYFSSKLSYAMCDNHPGTSYTTIDNCTFVGLNDYENYDTTKSYSIGDIVNVNQYLSASAKINNPTLNPVDDLTGSEWSYVTPSQAIGISYSGVTIVTNNRFYNVSTVIQERGNYKILHFENNIMSNINQICFDNLVYTDFYFINNTVINKYIYNASYLFNYTNQKTGIVSKNRVVNNMYAENIGLYYNNVTGLEKNIKFTNIRVNNDYDFSGRDAAFIKITKNAGSGTELIIDGLYYHGSNYLYMGDDDTIIFRNSIIDINFKYLMTNFLTTDIEYIGISGDITFNSTADNGYITRFTQSIDELYFDCNVINNTGYNIYWNNKKTPTKIIYEGSSKYNILTLNTSTNGKTAITTYYQESDTLPTLSSYEYGYTYYNDTLWFWTGSSWKILPLTTP